MCKGLTQRGLPCKSRACAEYCRVHLDQTPIPLYNSPIGWPRSRSIMGRVLKFSRLSADLVIVHLSLFQGSLWLNPPTYLHIPTPPYLTCIHACPPTRRPTYLDTEIHRYVRTCIHTYKYIHTYVQTYVLHTRTYSPTYLPTSYAHT